MYPSSRDVHRTKLREDVSMAIEQARHYQVPDADIYEVISDIQVELLGDVRLQEHYKGEIPPRLKHPTLQPLVRDGI